MKSTTSTETVLPAVLDGRDDARVETAERAAHSRFYRPELDGLRFFAFFAVYLQHTVNFGVGEHHHLANWVGDLCTTVGDAGTFGVDLFFVLSSYLITELLLRERAVKGVLDVKAFYVRRILRIWPLYFLYLIFAYAITFAVPSEGLTWKHLLGYVFFAGNWVYFLMPVATVAAPLWSVSLEEQFYLIWPWVVRRATPKRLALSSLGLIAMAAVVSLAMGIWQPDFDWVSKNSFTRVDGIAVGALLAVLLRGRIPRLGEGARLALFLTSVALLLLVAHNFGLFTLPVPLLTLVTGWPLAALACGSIVYSVLGSRGRWSSILRCAPIIYLGRISYGLYVYHELLLKLGDRIFPEHSSAPTQMIAYWAFGLIATLPVAAASYRWIESPFLRLKRSNYTVVQSRPD